MNIIRSMIVLAVIVCVMVPSHRSSDVVIARRLQRKRKWDFKGKNQELSEKNEELRTRLLRECNIKAEAVEPAVPIRKWKKGKKKQALYLENQALRAENERIEAELAECTTESPTKTPTESPTKTPTASPTGSPTTKSPIASPTGSPTTKSPTASPTGSPTTKSPTTSPTKTQTLHCIGDKQQLLKAFKNTDAQTILSWDLATEQWEGVSCDYCRYTSKRSEKKYRFYAITNTVDWSLPIWESFL